jgi:serine O-acetyltransferase
MMRLPVQTILEACEADLQAVVDRDPACEKFSQAMLYFKGFQAIQCHRLNHWLWRKRRRELAVLLQSRMSEVLHVDIHPAAQIGRGILMVRAPRPPLAPLLLPLLPSVYTSCMLQ